MTAAETAVRCAACGAAGGLYNRGDNYFCSDRSACRYRMAAYGDPVAAVADIARPPDSRPPPVPGATCSICGTTDPPGGVFHRAGVTFACLDRAGCNERAIEFQYLTAWSDSSPDRLISSADMRALAAAGGAQTGPGRPPLDPEEMAAEAWRASMGRKRG